MSSNLINDIALPIQDDLAQMKQRIKASIASSYDILGPISSHLIELRGKMMRPMLGMLCARLHGQINDKTYASAILFELLHHATLVHDDVIDEAYLRRGESTLGAMLRSRSAVLAGDFLFAKGLTQASVAGAFAQIEIATRAIERVVEGELAQSANSRTLDVDMAKYINVVRLKTSSLLSGVAQACALSVGASDEQCVAMRDLGDALGVAFQIQDDILDYTGSLATGKTLFNDIRERKITLPLLLAIEKYGNKQAPLSWIRQGKVEKVADFVLSSGAIQASREVMLSYHSRAMELIAAYESNDITQALSLYAHYVINRTK